ncbi:MAG: hypothetical protein H5T69_14005, partial [Chloroflexi bacterium]|nr:hypothetical protein [Chloroflexota bacterium]
NVAVMANVDDSATGGSSIVSAEYSLDSGSTWAPMAAQDGAFDEVTEDVLASFTAPGTAGIYELCVRGTDAAGNVGEPQCITFVVYDPAGGFVTGGGWIDSPAGAYMPNPAAPFTPTGKATFGFVSKYQKGASVPSGNTQFQFKAAGLNFHSTSYEWLVVTGSNYARYKGEGTINGAVAPNGAPYKLMLWAGDGTGPNGEDTFRLKIWYEEDGSEVVVYDNGMDQAIGGGEIKVHKAK